MKKPGFVANRKWAGSWRAAVVSESKHLRYQINSMLDFRVPAFTQALATLPPTPTENIATSEPFWSAVRALYTQSDAFVNLENGYWGAMANPVKDMFQYWIERVNFETTVLIRQHFPTLLEGLRARVADALGCAPDEIVLTRGATESMHALISGYNRLAPGDTVLYCDLDYPSTRDTMQWLGERRGVEPVRFSVPEPATRENVLDAYATMLRRHPRTRLVLLTHLSHSTGLVMPVREIAAMANEAGAEVIVDAAHSWGQLDFDVGSLNVPFAAFNLHKWVGAPLGCGALYIRRGNVSKIDPHFGDRDYPADDIRSRIHTGSPNFAAWLTLPAALDLHRRIGARAKEARLRALRNAWVERARILPGVRILTPDDPSMVAGITSFRLQGKTSKADNDAIVAALRDRHGLFTVARDGPDAGAGVRVTPATITSFADVSRLADALEELTRGA
jgi:isopenicillin-N epimerase